MPKKRAGLRGRPKKETESSSTEPVCPTREEAFFEQFVLSEQQKIQETEERMSVTMTNEQLESLLQGMGRLLSQQTTVQPPIASSTQTGNFSHCKTRFSGEKGEDVEAFIDAVTVYKECLHITDENALKGLPMLLDKLAATWFQGSKALLGSWQAAIDELRQVFSRKTPPHQMYRELFAREQSKGESTDTFVSNCRALLAKISEKVQLPEDHKLHMVYGLLHHRIREHLAREDIKDFTTLLNKARAIENTLNEIEEAENRKKQNKQRPKCSFCNNLGHTVEECRKKKTKQEDKVQEAIPVINSGGKTATGEIVCYGCKQPGHVRSQCPKKKQTGEVQAQSVDSKSVEILNTDVDDGRSSSPYLPVAIEGLMGVAQIDTGAKRSIAGSKLFAHLNKIGCRSSKIRLKLVMADGIPKEMDAVQFPTSVQVMGRQVPITFIALPDFRQNKSLLGLDFIKAAGIVLDIPHGNWFFADAPRTTHAFPVIDNPIALAVNTIDLRPEEGVDLTSSEKSELSTLLTANQTVFERKLVPTSFAEHTIRLTTKEPIAVPPYRLSDHRKQILKEALEEMLKDDIIEECESPYAAPVVLVPKKDDNFRVCVDYRELNKVTVPDKYPMPRLDDLLHAAKQTAFMSTLDLKSGYWQVPVREIDRDKTAFVCPFGLFRFKRMPFGLRTAPATFQRMMDRFRAGLSHILLLVYLDDVIVISTSFREHLRDLQQVFDRLNSCGLYANRDKCVFVRSRVRYLGHVITPGGIHPDRDKIAAILDRPRPINVTQIKSFLQTCSWFRRFIDDFARVSQPLTYLTRKNVPFVWATAQQEAFDTLKTKLTTAPILRQADPSISFKLKTDASSYAIGACLLQGDGEDERPVEYWSRLLTSAERNYTTTEREALAVVQALEKFRGYLEGATINVSSDHRPLKWLRSLKNPSGRLARWALTTQQFDLQIDYIPGRTNVVADTLSRPGGEHESSTEVNHVEINIPQKSAKEIRQEQLRDPDVNKILCCLEDEAAEPGNSRLYYEMRGYCLNDGILYRYSPDQDTSEPQLVVPNSMIPEILYDHHDAPCAGHYGIDKTCRKISQQYYWPTLHRDVTKHVKTCVDCQRYKASNQKTTGLVQTPPLARRFEVVAMDLFGPLPASTTGERWVLAIEDTTTRWIELFALQVANAEACAKCLIDEIILRYGCPRKLRSDNGVQFISDIMQQVAYVFGIGQNFTALYHPEANPEERRNRELKTQLAILVQTDSQNWHEKLPSIRFAMNSTVNSTTGFSPAYLNFVRELRSPCDAHRDLRSVIEGENVVEEITPYLKTIDGTLRRARETAEREQRRSKINADKHRRDIPSFEPGDKVWVQSHVLSNAAKGVSSKLAPRRDGPYLILKKVGPTSYEIAATTEPTKPLGKYHCSALTPYQPRDENFVPLPVYPKRGRGRPKKEGSRWIAGNSPIRSTSTTSDSISSDNEGTDDDEVSAGEMGVTTRSGRVRRQKRQCTASCCAI